MPFPARVTLADGRVAELRSVDELRNELRYYVGSGSPDSDSDSDYDYRCLVETTASDCASLRRFNNNWPFHYDTFVNIFSHAYVLIQDVNIFSHAYVLIQDVPMKQPKPELTLEQINQEASW